MGFIPQQQRILQLRDRHHHARTSALPAFNSADHDHQPRVGNLRDWVSKRDFVGEEAAVVVITSRRLTGAYVEL